MAGAGNPGSRGRHSTRQVRRKQECRLNRMGDPLHDISTRLDAPQQIHYIFR